MWQYASGPGLLEQLGAGSSWTGIVGVA
jgi:hypothetical protein